MGDMRAIEDVRPGDGVTLGMVEIDIEGTRSWYCKAFVVPWKADRWVRTVLAVKRSTTGRYRVVTGTVQT